MEAVDAEVGAAVGNSEMNNGVQHPGSNGDLGNSFELPEGVDGALLLDLIEDQPLSESDRATIGAWMVAHPSLARLVAEMRGDRATVQSLARVKAPAGLLDGVEAMLEREALLGLASAEVSLPAPIPISHFQPIIDRAERQLVWRRAGYGLAAAAGLAIVAAVSFIAVRDRGQTPQRGAGDSSLVAHGGGSGKDKAAAAPTNPQVPDREGIAVAMAENIGPPTPSDSELQANLLNDRDAVAIAALANEAAPGKVVNGPFGMSMDRAVALAREGRLLVTVKSANVDGATATLSRVKDKPLRGGRLRGMADAEAMQITSAVEREWKREFDLASRPAPFADKPNPVPIADPGSFADSNVHPQLPPIVSPKAEPPAMLGPAPLVLGGSVFALECSSDENAILGSLRGLRSALAPGERIELAELSQPADLGEVVDASTLMWWNSPSTWVKPVRAAVVVQQSSKQ